MDGYVETYYLVTCDHCVEKFVTARFCDGSTIGIKPESWVRPSSGDDVAMLDITDQMQIPFSNYGHIEAGNAIADHHLHFGVGVDVFMLGLFANEPDVGVNVPVARFGNLAARAISTFPIEQGNGRFRPSHFADMRSRDGFSGSPVFAYVATPALGDMVQKVGLLGIHSAQYKERISILGLDQEKVVEIASSMTKIVPAWILTELLESEACVSKRAERLNSTR